MLEILLTEIIFEEAVASKSAFDLTQQNGVLYDFFRQIIHPCFDLSTLSVTFTIKISTHIHTCKRKNNFVCTAVAYNFVLVFEEFAGLVQARTSGYSHRNSNLAHAQTECPSAVILQSPEYNVANVISIKLGSSSQCALTSCERMT